MIKNYDKFFTTDSRRKIVVMFTDGDIPPPEYEYERINEFLVDFFFVGIGGENEFIYRYDSKTGVTGDPHVTNFREDVLLKATAMVNGVYVPEAGNLVSLIINKLPSSEIVDVEITKSLIELSPFTAIVMFIACLFFYYFRRPI